MQRNCVTLFFIRYRFPGCRGVKNTVHDRAGGPEYSYESDERSATKEKLVSHGTAYSAENLEILVVVDFFVSAEAAGNLAEGRGERPLYRCRRRLVSQDSRRPLSTERQGTR